MSRWMLALAALAGFAALGYAALCIALFAMQRSLIYMPQPGTLAPGASQFVLAVDDALVRVTTSPARPGAGAVIYFGGNAEHVSLGLPQLRAAFPDDALYLLNYRGYGGSTGRPSEAALIADAMVLFDAVHTTHRKVVVVGRSLGSGVAVRLASVRPVQRLVLVTPYDSLQSLAASQYPYFPVRWLLRDKFESWRHVAGVTAPTSIIAAENDEVIPRANTESLYRRFPVGAATLRVVRGAGHNTILDSAEYLAFLRGAP
jgi:pimeloyl-ACP methyl ester carboxylesterase